MNPNFSLEAVLAVILTLLHLLLLPIILPARMIKDKLSVWREERHWKDPEGLDVEIGEILREARWAAANPRCTEEQQAEAREAWYQARRQNPTWLFVPRGPEEAGRSDAPGKHSKLPKSAPSEEVLALNRLKSAPCPSRSLKLRALTKIDTDQPFVPETEFAGCKSAPLSLSNRFRFFPSPTSQTNPTQDPNAKSGGRRISIHSVDSASISEAHQYQSLSAREAYDRKYWQEVAAREEENVLPPQAPTRLRWGDEWPRPLPDFAAKTPWFKRIADCDTEDCEPRSPPPNGSWLNVDLSGVAELPGSSGD